MLTLLSRESKAWITPAPVRRDRSPPPLVVRATAGRLAVLNAEFTFLSHAPRAAEARGAREAMYDDSEAEIPVAVRTRGVLGQIAGTGAYPDVAACTEEEMAKGRRRQGKKGCILYIRKMEDEELKEKG